MILGPPCARQHEYSGDRGEAQEVLKMQVVCRRDEHAKYMVLPMFVPYCSLRISFSYVDRGRDGAIQTEEAQ